MDSAASLLSPSSGSASSFSSHPLPSPRPLSPSSPSSSSCSYCSPTSFSPLTSPRPFHAPAAFAFSDLDSSFLCGSPPKPSFSFPLQPSPTAGRSRPPPINVRNYASSTTAQQQPSPQHWVASPRRTHYTILGVSPSSSPKEIRLAYRKLALHHHPDVSPLHQLDQATRLFAEINEAYSTLSDPQKKACYDLKLALDSSRAATTAPLHCQSVASPRMYTDTSTGRVYPSMNSFYREWRSSRH